MKQVAVILGILLSLTILIPLIAGSGDNKGKRFIMGFIENRILVKFPVIRIYVTSHDNGWVNFTVPLEWGQYPVDTRRVVPGKVVVKEYPYEMHMIGTDFNTKCILVQSNIDITVQGASINNLTTDGYLALPEEALGTDYYIMSFLYTEQSTTHRHGPSEFAVIALQDSTKVTLQAPPGVEIGSDDQIYLSKYEAYQVQSLRDDLTGTKVTSNYPVVVISGTDWTAVSGRYMGDHLLEQLLPTNTWGSEFIVAPLATRNNGDTFRVLAAHADTRVRVATIDNSLHFTFILNAGEYATYNTPSHIPTHVVATNGVMLAQFAKSFQSDNNRLSDPMMLVVPPVSQYTTWYTFSTIKTLRTDDKSNLESDLLFDNYLNVVIPFGTYDGFRFDGRKINRDIVEKKWNKFPGLDGKFYTIFTLKVEEGDHIIGHPDGIEFGAHLYGFKFQEAYGMPLGQKYGTIAHECHPTLMFEGDFFDNDCDGKIDEEILNGKDDDNDNLIDEDLEYVVRTDPPDVYHSSMEPSTSQENNDNGNGNGNNNGNGNGNDNGNDNGNGNGNGNENDNGNDNGNGNGGDTGGNTGDGDTSTGPGTDVTDIPHDQRTINTGNNPTGGTSGNGDVNPTSVDSTDEMGRGTGNPKTWTDSFGAGKENGTSGTHTNNPGDIGYNENNTFTQATNDETTIEGKLHQCHGITNDCDIEISFSGNESTVSWNDIQISKNQNISLGVFWAGNFWLFDGSTWHNRLGMGKVLINLNQTFCLLIDGSMWTWSDSKWLILFNITDIPSDNFSNETLYLYSDDFSMVFTNGGFRNDSSSNGVVEILSLLQAWDDMDGTERLAVLWGEYIWLFSTNSSHDNTHSIPTSELTLFWQSQSWLWTGSLWIQNENTSLKIDENKKLAILWSGILWSWNETHWIKTALNAPDNAPMDIPLVLLWNNRAWFLNSTQGPVEIYQGSYPNGLTRSKGPALVLNGTVYILTPEMVWVPLEPIKKPDSVLFDAALGASWGQSFWIFNSTTRGWFNSEVHELNMLDYQLGRKKPGLLFNGRYHQWSGNHWYVKSARESNGRRRRRRSVNEDSLINMWWGAESWQLINNKWSSSQESITAILGRATEDVGVLIIAVDGDIWIYNGTDWNGSSVRYNGIWAKTPLGAIYENYPWAWENDTLSGHENGIIDLGDKSKMVTDGQLAVIKEGTMWMYDKANWSDPIHITNMSETSKSEMTNIGVLVNGTLWFLGEDGVWTTDKGSIVTPKYQDTDKKPALLINNTLWILDKDNPANYIYTYISSIKLPGISFVWDGDVWSYDDQMSWKKKILTKSQLEQLPEKAIVLQNKVWSVFGPLLIQTDVQLHLETLDEPESYILQVYHLFGCHNWTLDSFVVSNSCLNEAETNFTGDNFVMIINNIKWMYNGSDWNILNITIWEREPSHSWTDNIGIILNKTVWIWNGTHMVPLDPSIDAGDLIGSNSTIVIFRYGYFWVWNGTLWLPHTSPDDIKDFMGEGGSTIGIGVGDSSWVWNDTHILPNPDSGSSSNGLEVRIDINGTTWICNTTECWVKPVKSIEETINELLENLPGGGGGVGVGGGNRTFWIWNGTAWVESNDWTSPGDGGDGNLSIYVDGKIWTWDGEKWVEGSKNNGHPGFENLPEDDNNDDTHSSGENEQTPGPPKISVTWNGTEWVWDGGKWVSGNKTLGANEGPGGGGEGGGGIQVTVNGTTWTWNGSSWVIIDTPVTDGNVNNTGSSLPLGETTDETTLGDYDDVTSRGESGLKGTDGGTGTDRGSTVHNGGSTGSSSNEITPNDGYQTTNDGLLPTDNDGTSSINDFTPEYGISGSTEQKMTDSMENATSGGDGTTGELSTGVEKREGTEEGSTIKEYSEAAYTVINSTPVPTHGLNGPQTPKPGEPDAGSSTEGGDKSKTVIIVVVVLVMLLLIVLLIILLCWCSKRKRKKKSRQKVNPSVAINAVPRPCSQYQHPPTVRPNSPGNYNEPCLFNFSNPSSSSSTSSVSPTPGPARAGRRSPRVSQAPPIDLPDLIISLPPGKHIHLKSPRLSPDPPLSSSHSSSYA